MSCGTLVYKILSLIQTTFVECAEFGLVMVTYPFGNHAQLCLSCATESSKKHITYYIYISANFVNRSTHCHSSCNCSCKQKEEVTLRLQYIAIMPIHVNMVE